MPCPAAAFAVVLWMGSISASLAVFMNTKMIFKRWMFIIWLFFQSLTQTLQETLLFALIKVALTLVSACLLTKIEPSKEIQLSSPYPFS